MATERSLPRESWTRFFDLMSKSLLGRSAEIEVSSLDLGDQIVAEWVPMLGITYEPHGDLLIVGLDRLNHQILHPLDILVQELSDGITSVAIVAQDGSKEVVRLKSPLMLPAAAG
jgi:hypothetical protein